MEGLAVMVGDDSFWQGVKGPSVCAVWCRGGGDGLAELLGDDSLWRVWEGSSV